MIFVVKKFDILVIFFMFITLFFMIPVNHANADVGWGLAFGIGASEKQIAVGMFGSLTAFNPDGKKMGGIFMNNDPVGVPTGIVLKAPFVLTDIDGDRIDSVSFYLQAENMQKVKGIVSFFDPNNPVSGEVTFDLKGLNGNFLLFADIEHEKVVTTWQIFCVRFDTSETGHSIGKMFELSVFDPSNQAFMTDPMAKYYYNFIPADGGGYIGWREHPISFLVSQEIKEKYGSSSNTANSSTSTQISTELVGDTARYAPLLNLTVDGGKPLSQTAGFYFVTSKPFSFAYTVFDKDGKARENRSVSEKDWVDIGGGLYTMENSPNIDPIGMSFLFCDKNVEYIAGINPVVDKTQDGNTYFVHDGKSGKVQVIEISRKEVK